MNIKEVESFQSCYDYDVRGKFYTAFLFFKCIHVIVDLKIQIIVNTIMSFNRLNFCAFFSIGYNSLFPSNYTVNCTKWGFDLNTCPCLRCVSGYIGLSCSHGMFSIIFADLIVSKLAQINRKSVTDVLFFLTKMVSIV